MYGPKSILTQGLGSPAYGPRVPQGWLALVWGLNLVPWLYISEKHLPQLAGAGKMKTALLSQISRGRSTHLSIITASGHVCTLTQQQSFLLLLPPAHWTLTQSRSGSAVAQQPAASNRPLCCIQVMRKLGIVWKGRDY